MNAEPNRLTSCSTNRSPSVALRWAVLLLLPVVAGCGAAADRLFCDDPSCVFTTEEWQRLKTLSPMPPVPPDTSNRFRDIQAAGDLGQIFYSDARFSGPATQVDALGRASTPARASLGQATGVSCATCHDLNRSGIDVTSIPGNVSAGAGWTDVNAPPTVNSVYQKLWFWNGRADSSWALAVAVAESKTTMNGNRLKTAWVIADNYRAAYDAVFGPAGFPLPLVGKSTDVAALVDPMTGQCVTANGACPPGCRQVSASAPSPPVVSCWPRFPLQGRKGSSEGCQGGVPVVPAEPFADAFDCMDPIDQDAVTRVLVNWAKALDSYEARLVSGETPFDRFATEGASSSAITPAAKLGARLFVGKAACIDCHSTALFSDRDFHNVGVPQVGPLVPTVDDCQANDLTCDCVTPKSCLPWGALDGLGKLGQNKFLRSSKWSDDPTGQTSLSPTDVLKLKGAWRTPNLRNVSLTAPYMHDGLYSTLAEVVAHYNAGGAVGAVGVNAAQIKPLFLTDEEQADLVAFLETLTASVNPGGS